MAAKLAVAKVERLVVDEQADDLAVGDVHQRLTGFRIAVGGLRMRQRTQLVERVQVRAGQAERLALVEISPQAEVPVGEREHRLRLGEGVEIELRLVHRPGLARGISPGSSSTLQQLAQVGDDEVGSRSAECVGVTGAIDAHDEAEPARASGGDTGKCVLEDRCVGGLDIERACRGEKRVRRGLPRQVLFLGAGCVDPDLEQVGQPRCLEGRAAVRAGRDDRTAQAGFPHGPHVPNRPLVGREPLPSDQLEHELVLAVAENGDRLGVDIDAARGEELADAVARGVCPSTYRS